ncbi:alpha/beta hydrolase [Paracoccus suum]|uniref:Alpha/beta hydrolase n=1 Tax=Paracoccus suum TaxID=2259340 RepID=A0A344PLS4_9RHOB|nr:alpha/beta hydrolase [Paracoccus suum]AXC50329.1 alpha/beta hydrolase [Paracoccus suum]
MRASTVRFGPHRIAAWSMGQGPGLLLVHGTPFSAHVWHRITPHLAPHFTVHSFDLLGYGQSDMPDADVSLGVQNGVLGAVMDHFGLNRPSVIAHDFGGATALRAHLRDGRDYARLLLIDPVAIRPWGSPFVAHVRRHEAAFAGLPPYIHAAILAAYLRGASHRGLTDTGLTPYLDPWTGAKGQEAFYRQIAQMDPVHTDEIEPLLGTVRCPVRLLWGVRDDWIPLADGRRLAAMLPDCPLTEVAGAGHLMQEDAPEAIVGAALEFLRH